MNEVHELPKTINGICEAIGISRSTFYRILEANPGIKKVNVRGASCPFYLQSEIAKAFYKTA